MPGWDEGDRADRALQESRAANHATEMCAATLSAIGRLRKAYDAAFACGKDAWDFSIELSQMQNAGVETHILRTLICKDWVIHKRETTLDQENKRTFLEVERTRGS